MRRRVQTFGLYCIRISMHKNLIRKQNRPLIPNMSIFHFAVSYQKEAFGRECNKPNFLIPEVNICRELIQVTVNCLKYTQEI